MQEYIPPSNREPATAAVPARKKHTDAERSGTEILLAITDLIVDSGALPDLFKSLVPLLRELVGCDVVSFTLHDAMKNGFVTDFWKNDQEVGLGKSFSLDESPCGWVWQHQEAMRIPDLERETRFGEALGEVRSLGVRSCMVLPMTTSRRRYGTLGIGCSEPGVNGAGDFLPLERAARLVALAVENHEIHRDWQKQQTRLQSLVAISRELSSTLELEQLVPLVFARMREITHYDYARLALLDAGGRSLRIRAIDSGQDKGAEWREGQQVPLAGAISAQAIETRRITFHDIEDVERSGSDMVEEIREAGLRSLCCVPLLMGSRALGTLVLGNVRKSAFGQEDGDYLQQVATQVAAAIHNATTYREITQVKDRLVQEKRYLENEVRGEQRGDEIVGSSPGLKRVLDYAAIVAHTDATVLITGETGTGKERVARAIHQMSARKERNFIKLNCAAIPTGLLESELFGHEKGAFTGAVSQKVGRLELADKGTLLLDEVGEIPLELQPKLLRVLQDQEFERLGGTKTIRVDVRLIAASNRDLARAVEEKEFRSDLFYRLHVFPLHLPALRERREDIPLLVRHFVERSGARLNKRIDFIPDEAVEAMMNYSWPGNIRELENFVERSVILSQGNRLRPPLAELRREAAKSKPDSEATLRDRERDHIVDVLRRSRGVLSGPTGAAARLGVKRTTLQYKIQKLGISRTDYMD